MDVIQSRGAKGRRETSRRTGVDRRFVVLYLGMLIVAGAVIARLAVLMVFSHGFYEALASGAHDVFEDLVPVRGSILLRDRDSTLYPVATNRDTFIIYAEPRRVTRAPEIADLLAPMLTMDREELAAKLSGGGYYSQLAKGIPEELADQISAALKEKDLQGIGMSREAARTYPEPGMGGQVLGFVGSDEKGERSGRYGVEGYWDKTLAGTQGYIAAEQDVSGNWIPVGDRKIVPAEDGADIVLTIDRAVQVFACERLRSEVERHGADGGALVIMDPMSGDIIAMCGAPDFDPNNYSKVEDISIFNNPAIIGEYESGSVMKPITMAAAIDQGKINPQSTYTDEGEVKLGPYTIKNSDGLAHGVKTMTQVLEESLNTGAIYTERQIGVETLRTYLEKFGFGSRTGIEISKENPGDLSSLRKKGEIYGATASYGQGITMTPIQLAAAYSAIANGGNLVTPRIVDEIRWSDTNIEKKESRIERQVISARTSTLVGGMLVSVIEKGHGKKAGVPGYWVAGKTGTAQVAKADGPGYRTDVTIGSFVGFAPVEDPKFVMVVRIDHPRDTQFAESTAAPLFGEIAKFLLQYYHVPPTRPIN